MNYLQREKYLGEVISEYIGNKNFYEHSMDSEVTENRYSLEEDINTLEYQDFSVCEWNKDNDTQFNPSVTYSFVGDVELGDLKSLLLKIKDYIEEFDDDEYIDGFGSNKQLSLELKSLCRVIERFSFSHDSEVRYRETQQSRNPETVF